MEMLVAAGGTAIFSETVEWTGAEHLLAQRAATPDVAQRIVAAVGERERMVRAAGGDIRGQNPGPQNKAGGITTIEEKALGAMSKGGRQPINDLLAAGQRPAGSGLYLMDTPFFSPESMTAMIAGGAHIVIFTTGAGNSYCSLVAPTLKMSANAEATARLTEQIDFAATGVLDGSVSLDAAACDGMQRLLEVASGALTFGEIVGEGAEVVSRIGGFDLTGEEVSLDPISQLSQYSTSIVSDALDELAVLGVLPGIEARRVGQGRVVGRALPVRLQPKSNDPSAYRFGGGVGKPLEQVLQTMQDGDIVVMDLGGSNRAAAWGGLASRIAQRRGVRGTIMWGACRDVDEIRAIGYPVWSVAVCPRRSRNEFTFGAINEPITIQGVTIAPRDFIIADESGVVCVPQGRFGEVIALCARIAVQERVLEAQVLNGSLESWDEV